MFARTITITATAALALCTVVPALAAPTGPVSPPNSASNPTTSLLPPNGTVKITIPVHVANMPPAYVGFTVSCSFSYVGQPILSDTINSQGTERGSADASLVKGAFDGNVYVTLKQATSAPSTISGYYCFLLFNTGGGAVPPPFSPARGAPYSQQVQGTF